MNSLKCAYINKIFRHIIDFLIIMLSSVMIKYLSFYNILYITYSQYSTWTRLNIIMTSNIAFFTLGNFAGTTFAFSREVYIKCWKCIFLSSLFCSNFSTSIVDSVVHKSFSKTSVIQFGEVSTL